MKRFIALLAAIAVAVTFISFGRNANADSAASPESPASSAQNAPTAGDKILVAYFTAAENSGVDAVSSASYTTVNGESIGTVRAIADVIAVRTGGDLFSIRTSVVYPTDREALIEYASEEQAGNARPELITEIDNLSQYGTIFVGYPIWWYDMPQVMYSFFDAYDFTGKTVIPFATHNGSGLSGTARTIGELEPGATVVTSGFSVNERDAGDAAADVADWLHTLGYKAPTRTADTAAEVSVPVSGMHEEQILPGAEGNIHYSFYIPENYDPAKKYPLMMAMPGYNMMWFGESSSGSNLSWSGFLSWTELDEDMIVVSTQLEDWGAKSARQAIELTEYFIDNYAVDTSRVYAAGYSAGGETMSQAVSMRPDLFAAYLHGASQWDGDYAPIAENGVAVYIYMAEGDEYYGSAKARSAYEGLYQAYRDAGWSDDDISSVLRLEIPGNEFFNSRGIYNYHGGANILFDDAENLEWISAHSK